MPILALTIVLDHKEAPVASVAELIANSVRMYSYSTCAFFFRFRILLVRAGVIRAVSILAIRHSHLIFLRALRTHFVLVYQLPKRAESLIPGF